MPAEAQVSEPEPSTRAADAADPPRDDDAGEPPSPTSGDDPFSPGAPPRIPHSPDVTLALETDDTDPPLSPWLEDQLARLAALAQVHDGELGVLIVGDDRMAELHEQYHADPSTTDVLTFDMRDAPDQPVEADLVLCLDEARRQAAQRGHTVREELLLYALHGLLHLIGYDDHDDADRAAMHNRENELLTQAGFRALYGT